jgi:hypothetical protein
VVRIYSCSIRTPIAILIVVACQFVLSIKVNINVMAPPTRSNIKKKDDTKRGKGEKKYEELEKERAGLMELKGTALWDDEQETRLNETDEELERLRASINTANSVTDESGQSSANIENPASTGAKASSTADSTSNKPSKLRADSSMAERASSSGPDKQAGPDPASKTVVDELGTKWNIDPVDTQSKSWLRGLQVEVIGHIEKRPTTRYVRRFGDEHGSSAIVDSQLPEDCIYNGSRNAATVSNRILENILDFHRRRKEPIPSTITQFLKVLVIYWDNKDECGYAADVEVLDPDYQGKRPNTRCFIYLPKQVYKEYGLENSTGFSHETRSTVLNFLNGNDHKGRSITLHNIAVKLENKFEELYMNNASNRPREPLSELFSGKPSRNRSRSRYTSIKESPALNPPPRRSGRLAQGPEIKVESCPPTPRPVAQPKEARLKSPDVRFRETLLKAFGTSSYKDLPEEVQEKYVVMFEKWLKNNA